MMQAAEDQLHDLYEKLHFSELERRDRINSRVPTLIAVIAALIGSQVYVMERALPPTSTILGIGQIALVAFSFMLILLAAFFLFQAWFTTRVDYFPTAFDIEQYFEELKRWKVSSKKPAKVLVDVDAKVRLKVREEFVTCQTYNALMNDTKSAKQKYAVYFILASAVLVIFGFIFQLVQLCNDKGTTISNLPRWI